MNKMSTVFTQDDEAPSSDFKRWTADDVRQLREAHPSTSLWGVVAWQFIAGLLVAMVVWLVAGSGWAAVSAGYGALAVVIPAAVFARGLRRQINANHAGGALGGFFVWELVKILLTVAMLVAAPKLIANLSWLALLAGFVVTMKVYWAALWFRPKYTQFAAKG